MLYSVMNQRTRGYDYFQTSEQEPWHSKAPPKPSSSSALGAVPEDAAWVLPPSAKYMGSGQTAKGKIAVRARGGGSLGALGAMEPAIAVVGAAAAMVVGLALLVKGGNQR